MMKTTMTSALLGLGLAVGLVMPASAQDAKVGAITVSQPFARATPGDAANGAAFMTITNDGDQPDRLVAAEAPVSKMTQLHTHILATIQGHQVMEMRQVKFIPVPAKGQTSLHPGGYHVMFMGLKAPLREGQSFPVKLTFAKAGTVTVTVPVEGVGAMGPMKHGH